MKNKRHILLVSLLAACWAVSGIAMPVRSDTIKPASLKCEGMEAALAIAEPNPMLSWGFSTNSNNLKQEAFHILVASSPEKLTEAAADRWNSGKVLSDCSIGVPYKGEKTKSGTVYFWKVKVYTNQGVSEWSEPARWKTGLLYFKDWQGRWIGFNRTFPGEETINDSRLAARYFRKEFKAERKIKSATAHIMGLGLYEWYLNGKKIGNQVLAPAPTDYLKNILYNTFDVTKELHTGGNAIGIVLGNGRFFAMRQHLKPYKNRSFGTPRLLFQLNVEYEDGSTESIISNDSWMGSANGPIRANNEYDGELYDARREMPGWNQPGFNDSSWIKAEYVQAPGGNYEPQVHPGMKVMKELKPVSVKKTSGNKFILDFGQNMTGWVAFKGKGARGKELRLRFAESLQENGDLFTANLRDAKNTDTYIFKGDGWEEWEPRFVYHGFRYVQMEGYTETPDPEFFTAKMIYDSMETVGSFESSDAMLNQLFRNAWWGIAGNYKGMPVDCPQRNERQPWLGDRPTGCYGENFLFDNASFYRKWMSDIAFSQKEDGAIPDVAPAFWNYYSDNMTWPGTLIMVGEMLYRQTGDVRSIATYYPAMKKWLFYMKDRYLTAEFIMPKDSYGDWCAPPATIAEGMGKNANVKHPSALIATAYFARFSRVMKAFAQLTGNIADTAQFQKMAEQSTEAFHRKFYQTSGYYGDGTVTENLLPLYFGLVPEMQMDSVFRHITRTIEVTNNSHLSTGLIGTQWLMRMLTDFGRPDLAFTLATQKTYPSWGYMVENGATTIWELWNGNTAAPNMNSQNHVMMLGDLLIWYFESLAGIASDPERPGFKRIIMKPVFPEKLRFVNAAHRSIHGEIKSSWKRKSGKMIWELSVPPNTSAEIHIPARTNTITQKGSPLPTQLKNKGTGIRLLSSGREKTVLEAGSGSYSFEW